MIARCDHEQIKNANGCIVEIIGEKNLDHFFVGTQDTDMRKKFQEILDSECGVVWHIKTTLESRTILLHALFLLVQRVWFQGGWRCIGGHLKFSPSFLSLACENTCKIMFIGFSL